MTARDATDARTAALAELGRIVLSQHAMESVLGRVAALARQVVPGAEEVSVTLLRHDRASTAASTGALASDLDERQYQRASGPCLDGARAGERVVVDDMTTDPRWPGYLREAVERGAPELPVGPRAAAAARHGRAQHLRHRSGRLRRRAFVRRQPGARGHLRASYAGVALANMHSYDSARQQALQLAEALGSRRGHRAGQGGAHGSSAL